MGLEQTPNQWGTERPRSNSIANNDHLKWLFDLVNELGDNKKQKGEQKRRASLFDEVVAEHGRVPQHSWCDVLIRAIQSNIFLIREGRTGRIEFSSQATYLGYLKRNVISMAEVYPGECDEPEWLEISNALRVVIPESDDSNASKLQISKDRQDNQHAAVNWLLTGLSDSGYKIPQNALNPGSIRSLHPTTATPVVLIQESHIQRVRELLAAWHADQQLQALQAALVLDLLGNAPLRWSEAACIAARDLLSDDNLICIQQAGFSHIKSNSSWRLIGISDSIKMQLVTLRDRLKSVGKPIGSEVFLFITGDIGMIDRSSSDWLHLDLTVALQAVTCSPHVRVHSLRARDISRIAFPDWDSKLMNWLGGRIGPVHLAVYFEYSPSNAWRLDEARRAAGHAQIHTTIGYYLFPSFQLRAMALAALLVNDRPHNTLIEALGVTMHALKKQGTRDASVRVDPWLFVQRHTPRSKLIPIADKAQIQTTHTEEEHDGEPLRPLVNFSLSVRYLALRLAGKDATFAMDKTEMSMSQATQLDQRFDNKTSVSQVLRGRVKGSTVGRAMDADIRQLFSDASEDFISLLSRANKTTASTLLYLMTGTARPKPWDEQLAQVSSDFAMTSWLLEFVCDRRHEDPELSTRLSQLNGLSAGRPAHDIGIQPRIYLIPKNEQDRNPVVKARLTVMARLLCKAYILFFQQPD